MQNPKITKTTDITGFEIFVMKGKPCPKLKGLKKQSYMDVVLEDGMKITDNCDNSKKKSLERSYFSCPSVINSEHEIMCLIFSNFYSSKYCKPYPVSLSIMLISLITNKLF